MAFEPSGDRSGRGSAAGGAAIGLLLASAFLGPAFLSGRVPARGDLPDFFWPMKAYTAARWVTDGPPLWNPLSGGGEPWLAQLQSGVFYPGDLPFLLGWREGAFLGIAFHLALAAAGAAFWARDLGTSRTAALLAGGLYSGGGAFLSLVPVYNNACTAAWLPWLFAGARRVVLGRSRGAGLAVAVAGAFLAGEPALAAVATAAGIALALWSGAEGEAPGVRVPAARAAARNAVPVVAGLALAAVSLAPFAELVAGSGRRERTTREEASARAVGASELADLVAAPRPEATRHAEPGRGGYLVTLAFGPLPLLLASGAGAGLPGRRRLLVGLGLLGAAGFVLSLGAPGLLAPALFDAGLLRGLRFPARWAVFPYLVLCLAAGAGLDGWLWGRLGLREHGEAGPDDEAEERERFARRTAVLAVAGAGLLVVAALAAVAWLVPEARAARDPLRTAVGAAAALLGGAAVLAARRSPGGASGGAAAFVAALAVVPLPYLGGEALASAPAATVGSPPELLAGIARGPEAGRVFAPAGQDRTLALRWRYANGLDWGPASVERAASSLAGYANLFHGVASVGSASPIGNPRAERLVGAALSGADPADVLALLDVRHVVTPFPTRLRGLRLAGERGGVLRYDAPGAFGRSFFPTQSRRATDDETFEALRGKGFDPGREALVAPAARGAPLPSPRPPGSWAAARFLSDAPERAELRTSASAASLLVFTRSWDPGWTALVDGEPVPTLRAQLALLAVVVPAGEHRLEIAYRPASYRIGLGLSAAGLLGVLALALAGPPGRRSR
jgi:hypothetical protein